MAMSKSSMFPFHELEWYLVRDLGDDAGRKAVQGDGQACLIHHTAARSPKLVILGHTGP